MPGDSLIGLFLVRDTPRPQSNALPLGISLTAEHILTASRANPHRARNTLKLSYRKREKAGGIEVLGGCKWKEEEKIEGGMSEAVISARAEYMNTGISGNQAKKTEYAVAVRQVEL